MGKKSRANVGLPAAKQKKFIPLSTSELPLDFFDIFGPFIQSLRMKNASGGKGLELAISEHIINLHRGRIFAKNNPDKPRSKFYFITPLSLSI